MLCLGLWKRFVSLWAQWAKVSKRKPNSWQEGAALKASSHGASLHIPSAYSGSVPILQMRKWFHKKLLGFTEFLDTSSCVCLKWWSLLTVAVVISEETSPTSSIFSQPSLPAPTAFPAPADPAPTCGSVTDCNTDFSCGKVHPSVFPWSNHPHYATGCISSFSSYVL